MKDFSGRLLSHSGRVLSRVGSKLSASAVPESIVVHGKEVSGLQPLGGYHRLGITKAGRLSFKGVCDGRPVKVYGVSSPAQADLRRAVQLLPAGKVFFPELIASNDLVVVEAWIEGNSLNKVSGHRSGHYKDYVSSFIEACHSSPALLLIATEHPDSFCYLRDYLLKRLEVWMGLAPVREFSDRWFEAFQAVRHLVPSRLCHPDLSADNLVVEFGTEKLFVVDNELLGVGPGWILDEKNSLLSTHSTSTPENLPASFVDFTWKLRKLGSALDAGDFSSALKLCKI